jgi:hypothetical protein
LKREAEYSERGVAAGLKDRAFLVEGNQAMTEDAGYHAAGRAPGARLRVRHVAAGAAVIAVGVVVWLVLRDGSSSSASPLPKGSKAVPISAKGLKTIAALGIQIYWVGERPGSTYELTKTADNRIFIRYLPGGVPVGSDKEYLTIATYPVKNAFAVTGRLAGKSSSVRIGIGKGGVAFYDQDTPTRVFLAHRGSDYQIEVYDPSPAQAQRIVATREVSAVR